MVFCGSAQVKPSSANPHKRSLYLTRKNLQNVIKKTLKAVLLTAQVNDTRKSRLSYVTGDARPIPISSQCFQDQVQGGGCSPPPHGAIKVSCDRCLCVMSMSGGFGFVGGGICMFVVVVVVVVVVVCTGGVVVVVVVVVVCTGGVVVVVCIGGVVVVVCIGGVVSMFPSLSICSVWKFSGKPFE